MKRRLFILTLALLLAITLSTNRTYAAIPSDAVMEESIYQTGTDYGDGSIIINYPSKIFKGSPRLPITVSLSNDDVVKVSQILIAEYHTASDSYIYSWQDVTDTSGGTLDTGETSSEILIDVDPSLTSETLTIIGYRFTYQYTTPDSFPLYESRDIEVINTATELTFTIDNSDLISPVIEGNNQVVADINNPPTLESIKSALTASDNVDGDITSSIVVGTDNYTENMDSIGNHTVEFTVTDTAGNTNQYWVSVRLVDYDKPIIILNGSQTMYIEYGSNFTDPGYQVTDNYDETVYNFKSGIVDDSKLGTYTINYNAQDSSGNVADIVTRTVVIQDTTAPEVVGGTTNITTYNSQSKTLTELLANVQVVDNYDGDISDSLSVDVDNYTASASTPGIYTVDISATDSNGNTMTHTLNITVEQDNAPTFSGSSYLVPLSQVSSMTAEEIIALMLGQ